MLKLNDKNVLVTGAAGKLGNYVSEYLHKKGYNVTCTDVVLPKPDSRIAKLKLPFVKGDLLDLGDIMKAIAMAQCGTIVHLGAIPFNVELQPPYDTTPKKGPSCGGVRSNYVMPEDNAMKINTMGTFYVMDAARRMGVKNVIAASSYYCYGLGMRISSVPFKPEYLPIDEKHPCTPEDTYSLSKHLGDEIMEAFCRAYDMNGIAMRLMGVYYPEVPWCRDCYKFGLDYITPENEDQGIINGDTHQYVDARDISYFIGLALEKKLTGFEAFNLVSDTTFNPDSASFYAKRFPYIADMCKNIEGHEGIFSGKKAKELLGYESQYTWRKGKQDLLDDDIFDNLK